MQSSQPLSFARCFSTQKDSSSEHIQLTHVDNQGSANMVDISDKTVTKRKATARGNIVFSTSKTIELIRANEMKKGDVLSVSRIAGIMAVKQTPNMIPLCHPLAITKINNEIYIQDENSIVVECTVNCEGKTGVEMEAIFGTLTTLATIYDMCKAADKHMTISDVRVIEKKGGRHDFTT
jgi:molybdenum cofactor biosynthesis protein MoaC